MGNIIYPHDDFIKRKHFPRYWPFGWAIHLSRVISPHNGHWGGTLMFSLICDWTNGCEYNRHNGDLKGHRTHYDVTVMARIASKEPSELLWLNWFKSARNDAHLNTINCKFRVHDLLAETMKITLMHKWTLTICLSFLSSLCHWQVTSGGKNQEWLTRYDTATSTVLCQRVPLILHSFWNDLNTHFLQCDTTSNRL